MFAPSDGLLWKSKMAAASDLIYVTVVTMEAN